MDYFDRGHGGIDMETLPNDVRAIRDMAIKAHGDQMYGNQPYSVHLDEVAGIVAAYGWDYVKLAYCHDILEDVPVTPEEHRVWEDRILDMGGQQFLDDCLLLKDQPGKNRQEKKAKTYAKMKESGPEFGRALVVKLGDRLANSRTSLRNNPRLLRTYQREHNAFKSAAYRPGIAEDLWGELDLVLGDSENTPEP